MTTEHNTSATPEPNSGSTQTILSNVQHQHFQKFYGLVFTYFKHHNKHERSRNEFDRKKMVEYKGKIVAYGQLLRKMGLEPVFDYIDPAPKLFDGKDI